jgi:hypothetical protein
MLEMQGLETGLVEAVDAKAQLRRRPNLAAPARQVLSSSTSTHKWLSTQSCNPVLS